MGSLGFSYDEEEHYTASASHGHQELKALDPEEFRQQAHKMVDFIADYYSNIESYPVLSQVQPGYLRDQMPENPPQKPDSLEAIFRDIQAQIMPGMTHWLSPKFFAFFPATVSTAAFLGEMLCTGFNAVGFNWLSSPAVTELEMTVMDWLANMLRLPSSFTFSGNGGGVIQGTTSEAVLVTLIASRDRALQGSAAGDIRRITVYCSDQTHATFAKAARLAGIHPRNVRTVPTSLADGFALSPARLREAISHDVEAGFVPLYLCATVGTTSTTAVDPLGPLADVAREYSLWVHVDAAYGGSACICPEFRHYLDGVERADSLSLSPHKWLLTYLDCCCLWVKQPDLLINALSTNPEYLKNKQSESSSVVEYKDWQVGTGRRFKSLRLWLVLRSHGVENLQAHIRSDVRMAKRFEGMVRSDPRFEVVVPRTFALVCFRLLNPYPYAGSGYTEVLNRKMLELVNSSGKVYMTHTIVGGVFMLRFAVGATLTEDRHVTAAWRLIKYSADDVLKKGSYNSLSPSASSPSSSSSTTSSASCVDIIMEK